MGEAVERVVAAQHARWGTDVVDTDVFGTGDPAAIAAIADRFCRGELGAGIDQGLFYGASVGCVLGVRLASGDEVVIKAYQERWRAPFLRAVQSVQAHVAGHGIPCGTPLRGPTALVPGRPNLAVIETYLPDPGLRPFSSAAERRVSATGLARQIAVCRGAAGAAGAGRPPTAPAHRRPLRRAAQPPVRLREHRSGSGVDRRAGDAGPARASTRTRARRSWPTRTGRRATSDSTSSACSPSTTGTAWRWWPRARQWGRPP